MKNKKIMIFVFGVVVILAGSYFYLQNKNSEFKLITDEGEMSLFVMKANQKELDEYYRKADEFYAQDIYGGDTPEETLELYIQALEIGDFELASKYFVFRDREKEFGELVSLNQLKLDSYLDILNSANPTSYNDIFGTYELRGFFEDKDVMIAKFTKNKEASIWKLESI